MKSAPAASSPLWISGFAWVVAGGAVLPVLSGALTANRLDGTGAVRGWALLLATLHPAIAAAAGLCVVGLAGSVLLLEKRPGTRRLAWMLLAGILVEGALGWRAAVTSPWGMAHAFLAPPLLASIVAIAITTSRHWRRDPQVLQDQGWPSLRALGRNTAVLAVLQVALGVAFRYGRMGVMYHILGALVVVVFILALMVLVTMLPEHPTLRPAVTSLGVIAFAQVFLGLTVVSLGPGTRLPVAVLGAAHVAIGSIVLAATVVAALEIRRNVRAQNEPR